MKTIKLPKPTSQCDEAPKVEMKDSDIIIRYIYEDEVSNNLILIKFKTVYSFRYIEAEYIDTIEYINGLVEVENSKWKSDLLNAWKLRDRPENEAFGGAVVSVNHYRVYFDEYGMYEIICKEIETGELSRD